MIPSHLQLLFITLLCAFAPMANAQRAVRNLPTTQSKHLAALGHAPDWSTIDRYHGTITRKELIHRLKHIFVEKGQSWEPWLTVSGTGDSAVVKIRTHAGDKKNPTVTLRLAAKGKSSTPPRYWTPAGDYPAPKSSARPLVGVHIAIDPGHIGGAYAKLEHRWFVIGDKPPVMEGEMTLKVAYLLRDRLSALGADVTLVRTRNAPISRIRPTHLTKLAKQNFRNQGVSHPPISQVKSLSTRWFCVSAEIRGRAELVNRIIKPDLVVCLHFNAEAWGNPAKPTLNDTNHLHILTNGCYAPSELALDDQRMEMLHKLLQGCATEEIAMSTAVAKRYAAANKMPAYVYKKNNARRVNRNPYVWARNLLASRLYQCPVVYMEPYVMNTVETFDRVQAGAYPGKKKIHGKMRPNIFVEYADAVAQGIADHFRAQRGK